jgi:hypothetical protein
MTRVIVCTLCVAAGIAAADPAPAVPGEKAGTDETLQIGATSDRPWANGVPDSEQKAALALFREANVLLNDGLFARAADQYRAALKHWDHPAIHYNLALALVNLDQPVDASEHLTLSVKFGEAPLQSKEKLDHARELQVLLDKEIADVEVSCDKKGAKVTVDGKEAFLAPGHFKTRVRVGRHTFVAEKQGYQTRINAPYIGPGEHFRIELKLFTAEELTRYHRRWKATWMPFAVGGAGLLVGFAGALFESSAQSSYRQYDQKVATCNEMTGGNLGCAPSASLTDLRSSGDSKRTIGFVMYGVAGATVVTAGVLYWLNRPDPYQIRPEDLQGEKLTVVPVIAPGFAGTSLLGRF